MLQDLQSQSILLFLDATSRKISPQPRDFLRWKTYTFLRASLLHGTSSLTPRRPVLLLSITLPSTCYFSPTSASPGSPGRNFFPYRCSFFLIKMPCWGQTFRILNLFFFFFFSCNSTLLDTKILRPFLGLGARSTHALTLFSGDSWARTDEGTTLQQRPISSMKSSRIRQRPAAN